MQRRALFDDRHAPVDNLRLLLEKAESVGLSSTVLLRRCNLSFSLADLRERRVSRVPIADFVRLRHACVIDIRHRIAPGSYDGMSRADFDFMCHSLITSTTLRELLERQSRFFEIGGRRDGWSALRTSGGDASFEIHLGPVEEGWEFFFTMNAFLVFARLMEWAIGEPLAASFAATCEENAENRAIALSFGRPLRFGAAFNQLLFPASLLERAIVRSPADLREFLLRFPDDASVPMDVSADLTMRVGGLYRDAMLHQRPLPSLDEVSRRLGIANATLRRRLDAEGASIRGIKHDVRAGLARELLRADDVPVGNIARALGFSGGKAFSRAFRTWTGTTAALFRASAKLGH